MIKVDGVDGGDEYETVKIWKKLKKREFELKNIYCNFSF